MDRTLHRTLLNTEKQRLLAAQKVFEDEQGITVDGRRTVDVDDASPQDPAEVSEQFSGRREVLNELEFLDAELAEIASALARLDAGTFGHCEVCGKPIDPERLEARPTARRCATDQRSFETGVTGLRS